jgi:hypothetical protein
MKASRVSLLLFVAYLLGCASHWAYTEYRIEQTRVGLDESVRRVFSVGQKFDAVHGWPKDGSEWTYNAQNHAFESAFPAPRDRSVRVIIGVDENKTIQSIRVVTTFVM